MDRITKNSKRIKSTFLISMSHPRCVSTVVKDFYPDPLPVWKLYHNVEKYSKTFLNPEFEMSLK